MTASQDRIPSSRTSRGAVEQPPRNEFRAPKQAGQEQSKQNKGNQASKQSINQACNETSKRSNKHTSKRANVQSSTRPNEQTIKQEVDGVPRTACNNTISKYHIKLSYVRELDTPTRREAPRQRDGDSVRGWIDAARKASGMASSPTYKQTSWLPKNDTNNNASANDDRKA